MHNERLVPKDARYLIRNNQALSTTSGVSLGYAQANIVIMPERYAADFHRFCSMHPKSCPILHISSAGERHAAALGDDIDICSDLSGYEIFRDGRKTESRTDINDLWQEDFVTFYIGCSFSFEEALLSHGVEIPHIRDGLNVAMYRTNIPLKSLGPFGGHLVVSMRALSVKDAIRAIQITSSMSRVHGAPIHIGEPAQIGIEDLYRPDYGDAPPTLAPAAMPTFWACGVTSQVAAIHAQLPLVITHAPGKMLITDIPNWELRFS